jgi:hypothetical protein
MQAMTTDAYALRPQKQLLAQFKAEEDGKRASRF